MAMSPARIHSETALEAAGYVRVSRKVQAEGHSPEIQREAIKRLARQEGYLLADELIEEDHERGSKLTREGYQRIIEAVREGRVQVVIVYMFDRWGRDGAEWLTRAREFDRLGVPIISVQEGRDEGGLMRFIRAGMAEEYSRQLAKRVRPAREKAAREGTHMGRTMFGYKRVYPAWDGKGRRPAAQLLPDEATAWIVRELFARYAAGGWSIRTLAAWLNDDPRVPPPARRERWASDTVRYILKSPTYKGVIRYNMHRKGFYETSQEGDTFEVDGQHEPLVDAVLWEEVQRRLHAARNRQTYNMPAKRVTLASGLLRCALCGNAMIPGQRRHDTTRKGEYSCLTRNRVAGACAASSYRIDVAHAGLLAEVQRLRGAPWTQEGIERLTGSADTDITDKATRLRRALDDEQERLRRLTRRIIEMEQDPTPEEKAVFQQVKTEIVARIRGLEEQLADTSERTAALPTLRDLHERLTHRHPADSIRQLLAQGDDDGLRDLLLGLVESARVVARWPAHRSTWVRVEVTWAPDVQMLLDAGLLSLDAEPSPPPPPEIPASLSAKRARDRRYYWRKHHPGLLPPDA